MTIIAQNFAFTPTSLSVMAGKSFTIAFQNLDASVGHNVHITKADGTDPFKYKLDGFGFDFVDGVGSAVLHVPALKAGAYPFTCDAHPEMTGTLTVK